MPNFFDIEKAIEVIVYTSHKKRDLFHIVKILYFADKVHLEKYGRLITGDRYIAMKDGPVPSGAYDIIKSVRGDGISKIDAQPERAFKVEDWTNIIPLREPNTDYLSESDIEALDKAIADYGKMDFGKLRKIVHKEKAYKQASQNSDISLKSIIQSLANADMLLEYLNS